MTLPTPATRSIMAISAPWSEYEKRFLLAEIIKTSPVSLDSLLRIVKEENIQPNWNEIFVPTARNVNACRAVFSDLLSNSPTTFQQLPRSFEATPPISKKRRHSDTEPIQSNVRALKPKPAENAPQGNAFRSSSGNAIPKKRGRPSKEDLAQRQAEAIARGEVYPPPKTPVRKSTGGAIPVSNLLAPAGPSDAQPPIVPPESPDSAKKKRGKGSFASKEVLMTNTIGDPPAVEAGLPAGDYNTIMGIPQSEPAKEEKSQETIPPVVSVQSSAEIPDSNVSSHTVFQPSGTV